MKRDLSKITEAHIKGIREWLDSGIKPFYCPFRIATPGCAVCKGIFPKFDQFKHYHPCRQYSISYVTRIAKEIVKEWEAP